MSGMRSIWRYFLGIAVGSAWIWTANCAYSQITPDRTLPNNSSVTVNGSTFNITGGTQAGRNLFHSFQQFSVPTGGTAFFNNAANIQNIFSRVTGGSVSNIDGIIQANATANVFFLNPSGIVFGKNASLNIGGSFVATTANAIQFGNQGTFSASVPNNPSLLTVNPTALFSNQISAGASIQNSSIAPAGINPNGDKTTGLRVPNGNSLLLVGGNINLDGGGLRAYDGHVELAGLATPGSIGLNVAGNTISLSVPDDVQRADVSLTNSSAISVFGTTGGDIAINARNLGISNSSLLGGIGIGLGDAGTVAGDIKLNATGAITLDQGSTISNTINTNGSGNSGNININAGSLSVQNGAQLGTLVYGRGNGGNIIINARDTVNFDGESDNTFSGAITYLQPGATGKAGDIQITSGTLSLTNGAFLGSSSSGNGNSGKITIDARSTVNLDGGSDANTSLQPGATGKAGDIGITSDTLSLTNGAFLGSDTLGKGNGGKITIDARSTVKLDGGSHADSAVDPNAIGNGGDIQITTGSLLLTNGAELSTSVLGQGDAGNIIIDARDNVHFDGVEGIASTGVESNLLTGGVGKGGNIQITTGSLSVTNGAGVNTNTDGRGNAGDITINARDTVTFDSVGKYPDGTPQPSWASSTLGMNSIGNGGDIHVTTRALLLTNDGQLNANNFGQGNAGSITIDASDTIAIDGISSNGLLRSGVQTVGSPGNGGNIVVTTGTLSLTNGGLVTSFSSANGGDITIHARDAINIANGALLAANSIKQGIAGNIEVTSDSIRLEHGFIIAATTLGNGGNITLTPQDLLLLRHDSQISTTAVATGNGGNITINTPNGFVVAAPNENNDITANAFNGAGGVIKINALGIYNFNQRSLADLETLLGTTDPSKLDPQKLPTNDITAISLTNPTLSGQVNIITPDIDPTRGLATLPTVTKQASKPISSSCAAFNEANGGSSFTITGSGGLPPSPNEPLTGDALWTDARLSVTTAQQHHHKTHAAKAKPQPVAIIPATGWAFNDKGEVTLISTATNATSANTPTSCPVR